MSIIETYDDATDIIDGRNGSNANIICRNVTAYTSVLREFGTVERRLLTAGKHPETHDLSMYTLRRVGV